MRGSAYALARSFSLHASTAHTRTQNARPVRFPRPASVRCSTFGRDEDLSVANVIGAWQGYDPRKPPQLNGNGHGHGHTAADPHSEEEDPTHPTLEFITGRKVGH